jgi:hypothetical protein
MEITFVDGAPWIDGRPVHEADPAKLATLPQANRLTTVNAGAMAGVMSCAHRVRPAGCGCIKCGPGGSRPGSKVSIDDCLSCLNLEG